jgi:hypothetical protein
MAEGREMTAMLGCTMICFRGSILHGRRRSVLDSMIMVVFSFHTVCFFSRNRKFSIDVLVSAVTTNGCSDIHPYIVFAEHLF